jgi:hypothetical protein
MAETFKQDTIGTVTASQRSGADRVREGLTLDATVGAGGNRGALAVDDIRRATGSRADIAMEDYLKDAFQKATVRGERLDINRAETYIRKNEALLERFPDGLQPAINRAVAAARSASTTRDKVDDAIKVLGDRNAPGIVGFVNAKGGQEVAKTLFEAERPAAAARSLLRAANKDQSGDAILGLKGGLLDEIIRRSSGKDGTINGEAFRRQLNDPKTRQLVGEILSPEEASRLRIIATQAQKLDKWDTITPEIIENAPNALVSTFLQVKAAQAGRAMGTGTIQVPGIFVKRTRDILARLSVDHADKLVHDAMKDPKIMAALLTGPGSSRAQVRKADQALTNWALGTLATLGEDEE